MRKPLASVLALLCALMSVPPAAWSDDPPTLTQLTTMLQNDGWKFDTDKKVFTKGDKTLYVNGDAVSVNPPSTQMAPPKPGAKTAGFKANDVPPNDNSQYQIKPKEEAPESMFHKIATNQATWVLGGGLLGGLMGAMILGPLGFLLGGMIGVVAGAVGHEHFIGSAPAKKK